jgi:Fur family ferric uptake transcriptional regulator
MNRDHDAMPLSSAGEGTYRVVSLSGGKGFIRKLGSMGLYHNAEIRVISAGRSGPVRISVKGVQFGLGKGMAARIQVRRASEQEGRQKRAYTLREYREGQRGKILEILGEGRFKRRIIEMGFVKGAEVYVEKYAPLRDPVEFVVKGYHVGLRRDEAEKIVMTEPYL